MKTILMLDDDSFYLNEYKNFFSKYYNFIVTDNLQLALKKIDEVNPDLLLLDIALKFDLDGLEILPFIKEKNKCLPVIMVTNYDSHTLFQKAKLYGATDYFVKSSDLKELKNLIESILAIEKTYASNQNNFIAESKPMLKILELVNRIANHDNTVLLIGESGSGKEILAKHIHKTSKRRNGPFMAINCGSFPENLIESELFGHDKGAFTGAYRKQKGMLELSDEGTLFLDEIEDLPMNAQIALLRALEDKKIKPIGSNNYLQVDFRLISASKNLNKYITENKFRKDLYFRIKGVVIEIPPLRERENDIIKLSNHFINDYCKKNNIPIKKLSQNSIKILLAYNFPGNVRELKNLLETAIIMGTSDEITASDLQLETAMRLKDKNIINDFKLEKEIKTQEFSEKVIKNALLQNGGNVKKTAKELKISRRHLYNLMKKFKIKT